MKIKVENLGVIKEGEIELGQDFVVFTGKNNQGKSYMAYLLYAYLTLRNDKSDNLYEVYKDKWVEFGKQTNFFKSKFIENGFYVNLDEINDGLRKLQTKFYEKYINTNLPEILAYQQTKAKFFEELGTSIKRGFAEKVEKKVKINDKTFEMLGNSNSLSIISDKYAISDNEEIENFVLKMLCLHNRQNTYFFPAERTAINMFYQDIIRQRASESEELTIKLQSASANEIVKAMQKEGKLQPRSPMAVNDYIHFANNFRNIVNNKPTTFADLATELENLLIGKVSVSDFGDLQFSPKKSKNSQNSLPLHLASSLVKSLAGLVIYLRFLANEGDVIIIDEPEINLHPENQILVARFFAKLVNRKINVILSTHSDYIIQELSNLIVLANDFKGKDKLLKKYHYQTTEILQPEKVAVYSFEDNTIKKIPTTEKGIEIQKINEVVADLNQRTNDLYYSYLENKTEKTATENE
jgi:predicted ATPase